MNFRKIVQSGVVIAGLGLNASPALADTVTLTARIDKVMLEDADSDSTPTAKVWVRLLTGAASKTCGATAAIDYGTLTLDNAAAREAFKGLVAALVGGQQIVLTSERTATGCQLMDVRF